MGSSNINLLNKIEEEENKTQKNKTQKESYYLDTSPRTSFKEFIQHMCEELNVNVSTDRINPDQISVFRCRELAETIIQKTTDDSLTYKLAVKFIKAGEETAMKIRELKETKEPAKPIHEQRADRCFAFVEAFATSYTNELRIKFHSLQTHNGVRESLEAVGYGFDEDGTLI